LKYFLLHARSPQTELLEPSMHGRFAQADSLGIAGQGQPPAGAFVYVSDDLVRHFLRPPGGVRWPLFTAHKRAGPVLGYFRRLDGVAWDGLPHDRGTIRGLHKPGHRLPSFGGHPVCLFCRDEIALAVCDRNEPEQRSKFIRCRVEVGWENWAAQLEPRRDLGQRLGDWVPFTTVGAGRGARDRSHLADAGSNACGFLPLSVLHAPSSTEPSRNHGQQCEVQPVGRGRTRGGVVARGSHGSLMGLKRGYLRAFQVCVARRFPPVGRRECWDSYLSSLR